MQILLTVFICFIAGIGAGLGTGFAGMSAAAVISPMLITFLGIEPYEAVGIALASDVLASAVSAYTYGKNKNLDIKNGLVMMAAVLVFTMVGSWVSSLVPSNTMGSFSVFMTMILGVKFIVKPVMTTKETMEQVSPKKRLIQSILCGINIEYTFDGILGLNMQKFITTEGQVLMGHNALSDTMKDLIIDAAGAAIASIVGYISILNDRKWMYPKLINQTDIKLDAANGG